LKTSFELATAAILLVVAEGFLKIQAMRLISILAENPDEE
jgi:hypothetical protein